MEFQSKGDLITAAVRELIITGEFEPGAQLRQRHLAARFNVSLTPVREALRRLESEGLIDYDLHRGARVVEAVSTPTEENHQVRAALEPLAAGLAAMRISEEELAELRAIHEQLKARHRRDEAAQELNRRFHFRIYEACRSPLLLALLRLLWRSLPDGLRLVRPLPLANQQHEGILAALERGSREDTERLAREHILGSLQYIQDRDPEEETAGQPDRGASESHT